jgi:hypothetical protein
MAGRRKGAQPGNTNALKHGFYSRYFKAGEITDLETVAGDLTSEIAMLRVMSRRLFERISFMEDDDQFKFDDYSALTALLSACSVRLASLMRTNHILTGNGTDLGEALAEALTHTIQELDLR